MNRPEVTGDERAAANREIDALRAQRGEALDDRDVLRRHLDALDELGRERDELKRRLRAEVDKVVNLTDELARARDSAAVRGDYVLLRLRDGRRERGGVK